MMYICNCIVPVSHCIVHLIIVNCLYSCFFLFPRLEHPAGWICTRYKSIFLIININTKCTSSNQSCCLSVKINHHCYILNVIRPGLIPNCVGTDRNYGSCNIQDCPEGSQDFREEQCAKYNSEPFQGKFYTWVPYLGGN